MTITDFYDPLDGDFLAEQLGIQTSFNPDSTSTQIDARKAIKKGANAPHLFLANQQKAAVGRFSRPFFTSPNGGIYMSLFLPYQAQNSYDLPPYTLMAASSLVRAISRLTGIETGIKWVNDIYKNHQKIAGILTETVTDKSTGQITGVIIGIGLNFYVTDFPQDLKNKAGSLFEQEPNISRNALIAEIWRLFFDIPVQDHIKVYRQKSLVLGHTVSFEENGCHYQGLARDVLASGSLEVLLPTGQLKYLSSGEISLLSW